MIKAQVRDDEFRTSSKFDATSWFEQASDDEILDLAKIDWGGNQAADAVAEFYEGHHVGEPDTVDAVFKAVNVLDTGYECYIDEADALRWVQENRPQLMDKINAG